MIRLALIYSLALFWMTPSAAAQSCQDSPLAVQILGSGGNRVNRDRASASYLVWIAGQGKILVDAGGGAFLRFGQTEAGVANLSLIAISHLHPDHVSDLPALLWSPGGGEKRPPLYVAGPSGNAVVPSFSTFLSRLFDQKDGAFPMLGGWMGGSGRWGVALDAVVIDATKREPSAVFSREDVTVTAIGVPHGNIPTLAYRVQAQTKTIVFSSDQNGDDPTFVEFARGADVLVMHMTRSGSEPDPDRLHASPDVVGQIARDARVGRLVLSHINFVDLEPAIAKVMKYYTGPLTVGADLECTPVP